MSNLCFLGVMVLQLLLLCTEVTVLQVKQVILYTTMIIIKFSIETFV